MLLVVVAVTSTSALKLENVLYEKNGPIAYKTINRPKVLNSLNAKTTPELRSAFEDARDDSGVREIRLLTQLIFAETPLANLLAIPNIPENKQVFCYCAGVADLEDTSLLKQDIRLTSHRPSSRPSSVSAAMQRSGMVRKLLAKGIREPLPIAITVLAGIRDGTMRRPKNLFVLCVIN